MTLDLFFKGDSGSFGGALRDAVFPVVSILTTAGFGHRADWDGWPLSSQFLLLCLFVVGGCAGSTSGGVKVARILLFFRIAYHEIVRAFRPKQVFPLELNGRRADDEKLDTVFYLALITLIFVISIVFVAILEPGVRDFPTAIGIVMSTLFNIGPGIGSVGPTDNFAWLGAPTKCFLCFLMLLGRLELFAILVLLAPSLWRKY